MILRDVIAIGSTTVDAFFKTNFKVIRWEKAPLGRALVVPFGEKFTSDEAYLTIGGNAANASITFARQRLKTSVFTKIGEDANAEHVMRSLKKEKVNTEFVFKSNLPTSYSILLLQGGERTIITHHGAINEFNLRDINLRKLKSKWWYASLPGDSYKSFSKLLKYARDNNIKVALNPSYKHLNGPGRKQLLGHLKDISFLVLNESEAATLTGISFKKSKEVFKRLDALVPGIVAVTSGPKGATVSDGRFIYKAGIFKNKKIVDRTGSGDAFGSGFVAGLIRSREKCVKNVCSPENIEYAIRLATANASSVVEHIGATENILTRKQFDTMPRFRALTINRKEL